MAICAIMQPTYLPWIGYFALMDMADVFVFLDDVQLSKQSWQTRNRIKSEAGKDLMLSVPVRHAGNQPIKDVEIDGAHWVAKHLRSFEQNYRKAPHFADAMMLFEPILRIEPAKLCDLNIALISGISDRLGITGKHINSSQIAEKSADRRDRLVDICKQFGADTYLSPAGAAGYLTEEEGEAQFAAHGMTLLYQRYEHPTYPQINGAFLSHMCALDLIANVGAGQAATIIRSGIRPSSAAQPAKETV
jgi:WbqC-like protein family